VKDLAAICIACIVLQFLLLLMAVHLLRYSQPAPAPPPAPRAEVSFDEVFKRRGLPRIIA
jgi:hypothetical protein